MNHDLENEISDAGEEHDALNFLKANPYIHQEALSIIFGGLRRASDRTTVFSPVQRPKRAKKPSIRKQKV